MVSCFFENPDKDARTAQPFWSPQVDPFVLTCTPTSAEDRAACGGVVLKNLDCVQTLVRTKCDEMHLLLSDRTHALHVVFDQEINLAQPFHFTVNAIGPENFTEQVQSITAFEALLRNRRFTRSCDRAPPKSRVLPQVLFALDLAFEGLSHRQIACQLFGEEAVHDGWDGLSDHLRSRTRRLLRKGQRLLRDGHKAFF